MPHLSLLTNEILKVLRENREMEKEFAYRMCSYNSTVTKFDIIEFQFIPIVSRLK